MAARCLSNRNASSLPQHERRSRAWPSAHTGTLTLSSECLEGGGSLPRKWAPAQASGCATRGRCGQSIRQAYIHGFLIAGVLTPVIAAASALIWRYMPYLAIAAGARLRTIC
jgi:hypothetical protein